VNELSIDITLLTFHFKKTFFNEKESYFWDTPRIYANNPAVIEAAAEYFTFNVVS
jgi:hypothetical protein